MSRDSGISLSAERQMSTDLVTIASDEKMETAYKRMKKYHLRHLPVVDHEGTIIGMLSDRDVQRSMISQITREKNGHKSHYFTSETIEFDSNAIVRDYMSWPVFYMSHDSDLQLVEERMLAERISSVLVEDHGKTVGIITTDDLLKVLIDLLKKPKSSTRLTLGSLIKPGQFGDYSDFSLSSLN